MVGTRGLVFVHSTPSALRPHIEWAAGGVLGMPIDVQWTPQPAEPGSWRAEFSWEGPVGTGARLAAAFRGWERIRYEVTEDFSATSEGQRWSYTPTLGVFHAATGPTGDIVVPEDRLRKAIVDEALGGKEIHAALDELLGRGWDEELEVFRHAGEDAPVRWLNRAV